LIEFAEILDKKPPCSEIESDFERVIPRFLKLTPGSAKSKEVARRLREFYFQNKVFDKNTYKEYIDVSTYLLLIDP